MAQNISGIPATRPPAPAGELPPPCPAAGGERPRKMGLLEAGDRVLFIGDSITNAFRMPDEINSAYQLGAGYALMIGGRLMAEFPEAAFHFVNRGNSGQRITQIGERWEIDCLGLAPSVVSMLVGVNSTMEKFKKKGVVEEDADWGRFSEIYEGLLRQLVARHPSVRLVLCGPFLLPCGTITPAMVEDVRERAGYVRKLASRHGAVFVPFQSAFDKAMERAPAEYWAYDGVHPTAAGFWLLAETWLDQVVRTASAL